MVVPAHALLIHVDLLDGRWHGAGDWPPSPFRLFQALVAGAYGGRWAAENATDKDAAFRWLERLDPPAIAAPPRAAGPRSRRGGAAGPRHPPREPGLRAPRSRRRDRRADDRGRRVPIGEVGELVLAGPVGLTTPALHEAAMPGAMPSWTG